MCKGDNASTAGSTTKHKKWINHQLLASIMSFTPITKTPTVNTCTSVSASINCCTCAKTYKIPSGSGTNGLDAFLRVYGVEG